MTTESDSIQPVTARIFAAVWRFRNLGQSGKLRTPLLIAASLVFSCGLYISISQLPRDIGLAHPAYLALSALLAVPAAILLTTIETRLGAALVGARFGWLQATHIGLVSSAANMLPLPGGAVVRVAALKVAGASLLKSGISTTLIGALWVGLAFGFAGIRLIAAHPTVGTPLLVVGCLATTAISIALFRLCSSWRLVVALLATKSAGVAIGVLRMYWALTALGLLVSFSEVWVFAVADVSGPAIAIIPAGLGVTETVAAVLAPLIDISAAAAFLAVGLNRLIALPVMLVATGTVAAIRSRFERQPGE